MAGLEPAASTTRMWNDTNFTTPSGQAVCPPMLAYLNGPPVNVGTAGIEPANISTSFVAILRKGISKSITKCQLFLR